MEIKIPEGTWKQIHLSIIDQIIEYYLLESPSKIAVARRLGMSERMLYHYMKKSEVLNKYISKSPVWYNSKTKRSKKDYENYLRMKRIYPDE